MAWFVMQSLFVILLAFLLGLLVGRLVGTRRREWPEQVVEAEPGIEPEPAVQPELSVLHVPDVAASEASQALTVPEVQDRLERIEGIGPKIATALRQSGVTTFASLAAADEDTLREALRTAHLRFAPSLPTWPRQARLLAEGDEAGFAELTAGMAAGRGASGVS